MELTGGKHIRGTCSGMCCLKIENLGVKFGKKVILSDVNLHVHCGELTAVIGPNGAGKSTLLKAILGEVKHTGSLQFVNAFSEMAQRPLIGYVPQHLEFDAGAPASVFDLFMSCTSRLPVWLMKPSGIRKNVLNALERVEAAHLIDRSLGSLSGGELQRVLLALALEPLPNLLLLDEPVSGVDRKGLELFYDLVSEMRKRHDLSIILVSHDLELIAQHADRVLLLNGTVLSSGTPGEVYASSAFFEIFGDNGFRGGSK